VNFVSTRAIQFVVRYLGALRLLWEVKGCRSYFRQRFCSIRAVSTGTRGNTNILSSSNTNRLHVKIFPKIRVSVIATWSIRIWFHSVWPFWLLWKVESWRSNQSHPVAFFWTISTRTWGNWNSFFSPGPNCHLINILSEIVNGFVLSRAVLIAFVCVQTRCLFWKVYCWSSCHYFWISLFRIVGSWPRSHWDMFVPFNSNS
jgi:hypothetical protein